MISESKTFIKKEQVFQTSGIHIKIVLKMTKSSGWINIKFLK
jgi:hypothetical protein